MAAGPLKSPSELGITHQGIIQDPSDRIFVNRNLRFDHISHVGFDMDYTLAPYVKRNIEELSFRMTKERLVEKWNYPKEVLDIAYDKEFVVRGLVVDKKLGNIFKMDGYNHVGRVFHGRSMLSKDERRRLYRNVKIRLSANRYHWIDTLFALPEAVLYADIIELFEKREKGQAIDYAKLFSEIRTAIDECHRDDSLKTIIKSDLAHYIELDPLLPYTLHKLRSSGKKIFVLTNSYWEYTNAVMSFLLNDRLAAYSHWTSFFDLIVVGAQKPRFFTEEGIPFFAIDKQSGNLSDRPATAFEPRGVYQGGCIRLFEKLLGSHGENILYVGDHIYGDIIRSKKDSLWRTALVLEELEDEIRKSIDLQRAQAEIVSIQEQSALLDHEINVIKLALSTSAPEEQDELTHRQLRTMLDRKRRDLKAVISRRGRLEYEIQRSYNKYWGSVFKEGNEVSRFGRQVERYACIYTSKVSNLIFYSPSQYFRSPRHWMAHEKA